MKIIIFGINESKKIDFIKSNEKYNFDITFCPDILTKKNIDLCRNHDAIVSNTLDELNEENIKKISEEFNIKIITTRSAGTNNIDINLFKKYNISSAHGGGYSPSAVAEFALALSMNLSTHIQTSAYDMQLGNYHEREKYQRVEIKSSVVGIVGVGTIGLTTAKLFHSLGAKIIGYDSYESDKAKEIVDFMPLDSLLAKADIVICVAAYIPGKNDNMFNKSKFNIMKNGAIFVNVSRGELHNDVDLYNALISNKLMGAATDVLRNEHKFLFDKNSDLPKEELKLINLYPKFIWTPHIAYFSSDALKDMAEIALDNIDKLNKGLNLHRQLC